MHPLQSLNVSLTSGSTDDLLKAVKQATARFHSTTQAIKAGYQPNNHCVFNPAIGGMGYHWSKPSSLIDANFDPLNPEVILYAPDKNGNLKLVAVEYIVRNTGQTAPTFGTQAFDVGGTPLPAPHWSLHVWLYEENPLGMFARFNANVTCP